MSLIQIKQTLERDNPMKSNLPLLMLTMFSFFNMLNAFDSDEAWRHIAATLAFVGIASMTTLNYFLLKKKRNQID